MFCTDLQSGSPICICHCEIKTEGEPKLLLQVQIVILHLGLGEFSHAKLKFGYLIQIQKSYYCKVFHQ